jgi:hypothetical protein
MTRRNIPALLLLAALVGCNSFLGTEIPTAIPPEFMPTAIARTQTALAEATALAQGASDTPTPRVDESVTPTPSPTKTPRPTYTPKNTYTPSPELYPDAAIQIAAPGPMSRVLSPIKLRVHLVPGWQHKLRIELFGEDGRLLARQVTTAYSVQPWAWLFVDVPFEVGAVAEVARLQVSTEDQYGRINALSSVRLLLLSSGYEEINPPGPVWERCLIIAPKPEGEARGGMVIVSGKIRPVNEQPLIVELTTTDGAIIATRLVYVLPPKGDVYVPFATDVPYSVVEPIVVRLSVRQLDDRIGGTAYLYSQLLTLFP